MKTTYYIINKSDMSSCKSSRSAFSVSAYMLGRRVDNYILIKEDDRGARVIPIIDAEVLKIEQALEKG